MNTNNIENKIFGIVAIWKAKAKDCIDNDEMPPTFAEVAMEEFNRVGKTKIQFENGGCFEFPASKGNDVLKIESMSFPVCGRYQYGASPIGASGGDRGDFVKLLKAAMDSEDYKRDVPWGVEDEGLLAGLSKESREVLEKYRNRLGERGFFVEIPDFPEFPEVICEDNWKIKPIPHMSDAMHSAMHHALRHEFAIPGFQSSDSVFARCLDDVKMAIPCHFRERRTLVKAQRAVWKNRKLGL